MYPFGHIGIGIHLLPRSLRVRLPWRWMVFGCLLPDTTLLDAAKKLEMDFHRELENARVSGAGN